MALLPAVVPLLYSFYLQLMGIENTHISSRLLKILLLFLVLLDLGYSYKQYYHQPFGGDLVPLILPTEKNKTVLENPFGQKAILEGTKFQKMLSSL